MQFKQFYNIATKVSSRKRCNYFWWSNWLVRHLTGDSLMTIWLGYFFSIFLTKMYPGVFLPNRWIALEVVHNNHLIYTDVTPRNWQICRYFYASNPKWHSISFNHTGTRALGFRPELSSQTLVFGSCGRCGNFETTLKFRSRTILFHTTILYRVRVQLYPSCDRTMILSYHCDMLLSQLF